MTLASKDPLIEIGQSKAGFRDSLESLYDHVAALLGTSGTEAAAQAALRTFPGGGVAARISTTTLLTSNRGQVLECTGTWTLTLLPAATAGNGFCFAVKNQGTGIITLAPSGGETVDVGQVLPGDSVILVCTGVAWIVVGGGSGVTPVAQGGTGASNADTACDNIGAVRVNAALGAVGVYTTLQTRYNLDIYTPGATYSLPGLSGTWMSLARHLVGEGTYYYLNLFKRIS